MTELPASFGGLSQSVLVNGVIDISGPGVVTPTLTGLNQIYCGPVYLITYLDGPQCNN